MQGIPLPIRQDKSFPKAGNSQPGNVRKLRCHLPDNGIYPIHYYRNINFVTSHRPYYRVITVRLPQIITLLIKYGAFAASSSDIKSRDFHPDPPIFYNKCPKSPYYPMAFRAFH
jgi:hypothetical protein